MQFRFKPVSSFEDTQGNFEQLEGILPKGFLQLLTAADVHVAYGSTTVVWNGVDWWTPGVSVSHGLPGAPTVVLATGNYDYVVFMAAVGTVTASTFLVTGQTPANSVPAAGSSIVYWLAIG